MGRLLFTCRGVHKHEYAPNEPKPHDMDEPPSMDEIIKTHYMKHHPFYEYKGYDELNIDPYRYWVHSRIEYYNTVTWPMQPGVHAVHDFP